MVAINNASSTILTADNLTYSSNSSIQPSINISSSPAVILTINDEQKQHIIHLLDEWCDKIKEDNNQQRIKVKQGVDYELIVDYMSNKALIKCQCVVELRSSFNKSQSMCYMIQQKVKDTGDTMVQHFLSSNNNTNTFDDPIISAVSNSTPSSQTITGKRKRI
ncbi:unnamed protein product, partial [Rotaria magnacalcarata]